MLCVDTSSLIAYLEGAEGEDVNTIDQAFADQVGVITSVTVTKVLSDPSLNKNVRETILQLPVLFIIGRFLGTRGAVEGKGFARGSQGQAG